MKKLFAALGILGCIMTSAVAQRLQPSRDVVVSYRVEGPAAELVPGGLPGPVRLLWDARGRRVRIEPSGRTQVVLFDLSRHDGKVIDLALKVVLRFSVRASDLQPLTMESTRLSLPRGQALVAGLTCTVYRVESGSGGSVCLTDDGVPLRGEGDVRHRVGRFEALSVRFGSVPPSSFEPPPGYVLLDGVGSGGRELQGLAGRLGLGTLGRVPP